MNGKSSAEPHKPDAPSAAEISCIVLSVRFAQSLETAVKSLLDQDHPAEIIVVNSGGGTAGQQLVQWQAAGRLKLIDHPEQLFPGAARNLGIQSATTAYVAFLSSDCIALPGWIEHRLRRHRNGAAMVSSAVVPLQSWRPAAWAAQCYYYPRRLPGSAEADRIHYGVSYDKALFEQLGLFNGFVKRGEDSEFHQRCESLPPPAWAGAEVITAHRHPDNLASLLIDAIRRGHRLVFAIKETRMADIVLRQHEAWARQKAQRLAQPAHEPSGPAAADRPSRLASIKARVIKQGRAKLLKPCLRWFRKPKADQDREPRKTHWARVRTAHQLALSACAPADRNKLRLARPYVHLTDLAFRTGVFLGHRANRRQPAVINAANPGYAIPFVCRDSKRFKLYAMLAFRNEMQHLPAYFENIRQQVDGVIALDDGSSDGSYEFVARQPSVLRLIRRPQGTGEPGSWDCGLNRRLLVEAAWPFEPQWLLGLDADERLEINFRRRAEQRLALPRHRGVHAFAIRVLHTWNGPQQVRVDGDWTKRSVARLFRARYDHVFDTRRLHGHWAPLNGMVNRHFREVDLIMYHLAMQSNEDRQQRIRKYQREDPNNELKSIRYDRMKKRPKTIVRPIARERRYLPIADTDRA